MVWKRSWKNVVTAQRRRHRHLRYESNRYQILKTPRFFLLMLFFIINIYAATSLC